MVKYNLNKLENDNLILREAEVSRGLSLNWDKLKAAGMLDMADRRAINGRVEEINQATERVVSFSASSWATSPPVSPD